MATVDKFEDLEAWRKARELVRGVYAATAEKSFARDFALRDQMRRAAVSAMSNIAEGFDRKGNREFIHFLSIAKGSAAEVKSQLYVALDAGHIDDDAFETLRGLTDDTSRLIGGLMRYLSRSERERTRSKDT